MRHSEDSAEDDQTRKPKLHDKNSNFDRIWHC